MRRFWIIVLAIGICTALYGGHLSFSESENGSSSTTRSDVRATSAQEFRCERVCNSDLQQPQSQPSIGSDSYRVLTARPSQRTCSLCGVKSYTPHNSSAFTTVTFEIFNHSIFFGAERAVAYLRLLRRLVI